MPVIQSCLPVLTAGTSRHKIRKIIWNLKKKKTNTETSFIICLGESRVSCLHFKGVWWVNSRDMNALVGR